MKRTTWGSMAEPIRNEFQLSATPDEQLSRHLAYLAAQDSGAVLTGGFARDRSGFDGDSSEKQASRTLDILTQQEQIRQQQAEALASRLDALELAARGTLTDAENDLAYILSNANRDRLGRAVFMDESGTIRNEDGHAVDPSVVDMSDWDPDAASFETFTEGLERRDRAAETYGRVQDVRAEAEGRELDEQEMNSVLDDLDALEAEISALGEIGNDDNVSIERPAIGLADPAPTSSNEPTPFKPM